MKSIRNTILSLLIILTGCTPYYYECEIGEADKADLPQTASVIDVPYSYVLVQTKFQPGIVGQDFRYRATVDGTEYSAAENPGFPDPLSDGAQAFQVVVPENDSHLQRTVRIEASVKDLFWKKKWGEWKTVYEGTQAALPKGEPLALEGIGSRTVRIVTEDGTSVDLDIETGPSGMALRAVLAEILVAAQAQEDLRVHDILSDNAPVPDFGLRRVFFCKHGLLQPYHQAVAWLWKW